MKTLNGYLIKDLTTILDQPLPPSAYKKIPAGALNLTDIDAGWQRRAFNKIFGLYGIGWGFEFDNRDMDLRHEANKNDKILPFVRVYGRFWYKYIDNNGTECQASFPVTGANSSQSGNEAYALKGAITNAIGFGASMIGWQESVYLGARSHDNTEGFAEGKDWAPIEPGDEPPPTSAEPTKQASVAPAKPVKQTPAAKPAELPPEPVTPDPEPEKKPLPENPSLAEKLGFESIKHPVCLHCGWAEPVNYLPEACPTCGVVADKAFSVAQSHSHMIEMQNNIKAKLALKDGAAQIKPMLDEIKRRCSNNRGLILQSLTRAAGREIRNYSEASPKDLETCLHQLPANPVDGAKIGGETTTATTRPKMDKAQLTEKIFNVGRSLNLGTPRQIIAEIGKVAGKQIASATQLNENELLAVLENFEGRTAV